MAKNERRRTEKEVQKKKMEEKVPRSIIHLAAFAIKFEKGTKEEKSKRAFEKEKNARKLAPKRAFIYARERANAREQRETPKKRLSLFSRAIVVSLFEKSADFCVCVCEKRARLVRVIRRDLARREFFRHSGRERELSFVVCCLLRGKEREREKEREH
jgi:hypothetical protein